MIMELTLTNSSSPEPPRSHSSWSLRSPPLLRSTFVLKSSNQGYLRQHLADVLVTALLGRGDREEGNQGGDIQDKEH